LINIFFVDYIDIAKDLKEKIYLLNKNLDNNLQYLLINKNKISSSYKMKGHYELLKENINIIKEKNNELIFKLDFYINWIENIN